MSFQDVTLTWGGKEGRIPSTRVLRTIASVEDAVTVAELAACVGRQTIPVAKISLAYGAMLRAAGFEVTDEEVYTELANNQHQQSVMTSSVLTLMALMLPPGAFKDATVHKLTEVVTGPNGSSSSSRPTKPASSPKDGLGQKNSGVSRRAKSGGKSKPDKTARDTAG